MLFTICGCSSKSDNNSSEMSTIQNTEIKEDVSNSETDEGDADSSTQTETTSDGETSENDKTSNPTESSIPVTSSTSKPTTSTPSTTTDKEDKPLSSACSHMNTEIRNTKDATETSEGYTGDTYCKDCHLKISIGTTIPKIKTDNDGKVTYTTNNGYTYVVDEGTNIMEYSMKQQTKSINSKYREFEMEILRLCNEERAKVGLAPLEWYEDAYYFTYIRAEESSITFSHTRPNWSNWDTVYTDAGVILHGVWGENLFYAEGWPAYEIAEEAVKNWMNSPGHKANILNPEYKRLTVAIYEKYIGEVYCLSVTQNFFG